MRPTKEGHFHYKSDSVARVRIVDGELWFCTTHGWQGRVSMSDDSVWGPEIPAYDWPPTNPGSCPACEKLRGMVRARNEQLAKCGVSLRLIEELIP